jgi:hypothetical protein
VRIVTAERAKWGDSSKEIFRLSYEGANCALPVVGASVEPLRERLGKMVSSSELLTGLSYSPIRPLTQQGKNNAASTQVQKNYE